MFVCVWEIRKEKKETEGGKEEKEGKMYSVVLEGTTVVSKC